MEVSPDQPSHILDSNFSNNKVRLPQHIEIDHATNFSDIVYAVERVTKKSVSIGRHEDNNKPNPTSFDYPTSVSAMHYKPIESRKTAMNNRDVV